MPAGPEKFAGYLPIFQKQQPLRRPWDDRGRDRHLRRPEHLGRIPQTQRRPGWIAFVPVDVRKQRLALQHLLADERIPHMDGDVGVREGPTVEVRTQEVYDSDAVGFGCRF